MIHKCQGHPRFRSYGFKAQIRVNDVTGILGGYGSVLFILAYKLFKT